MILGERHDISDIVHLAGGIPGADLPLPAAPLPHLIVAFKKAVEPAFDLATAVADYVTWRAAHPR